MISHLSDRSGLIELAGSSIAEKSDVFADAVWNITLEFVVDRLQQNDKILAPEEFCDRFPNSYPYLHSYSESFHFFDWIVIHKGKINELNLRFLVGLCRTNAPVFANEVFVVFSPSQKIRKAKFHQDHFRSLLVLIGQMQTNRLIKKIKDFRVKSKPEQSGREQFGREQFGREQFGRKQSGRDKPQAPLLIERRFEPRGWFSYHQSPPFVPLSWAATSEEQPYANLGDALSPIIVSALSGIPTQHRDFQSHQRRLAAVGTIAHGLKHGAVHFWGTGTDAQKTAGNSHASSSTQFHVHAVRGLRTAQILRRQGIDVPPIYGDPVWFLPALIPPAPTKQYELGIVVHLSELTDLTDQATVKPGFLCYDIPASIASGIRIITTLTQPTFADLEKRTQEITACKRIVSTSLHGLVIAEAYGIPCAYFWNKGGGTVFAQIDDETQRIDWRMRDFYSGVGVQERFIYGQRRIKPTDWEAVIQAIDTYWNPIEWSPEAFLESFPLPLAFNPLRGETLQNRSLLHQLKL